jgi:hypothetical protein
MQQLPRLTVLPPHGNNWLPVAHVRRANVGCVSVLVGDGTSSMATAIRDVTGSELRLFGDIVARLERLGPESDARAVIFMDVMRLLRSDFGASYVWNPRKAASTKR